MSSFKISQIFLLSQDMSQTIPHKLDLLLGH